MKKNYPMHLSANTLRNFSLLFLIFIGSIFQAAAQVRAPFTQRTSADSPNRKIYNINGDFTMIGNTNMTVLDYTDTKMNSNNYMYQLDKDNDTSTDNSSSATLTFSTENNASPECSNILFAGLYWTGRTAYNVPDSRKKKIKFKGPNGSYQNIQASSYNIPGDNNMYAAYAEVTDIVRNGGTGEYWVADIAVSEGNGGSTGYYGGWGMIVIYENQQMNLRDVTVFDGYAYVEGNATRQFEIPVSGFNTAQAGDINMKLGMMAGEGDRGISGDYFSIKKRNGNSWQSLSHSLNSTDNFFNSSIQTNGSRNPDLPNNTGLDISMFNVDNHNNQVIGNNQTSTTFRYGSTQDTYIIFNMAMSVDAYTPDFDAVTSIDQETAEPGEEITYNIDLYNKGSEEIEDAKIIIPVPFNLEYVGNETQFNGQAPSPNNVSYDPSLGINGSIVWNIGTLEVPSDKSNILGSLDLIFKVTEDCNILKNSTCGNQFQIPFTGTLSGKGAITGATFTDKGLIQGYQQNGQCYGQPITSPLIVGIDATEYIENNCQATPEELSFSTCDTQNGFSVSDLQSYFPAGSRFYDSFPVTSGSNEITTKFPVTSGTTTYYAILKGSNSCYIPFNIVIDEITSVPAVENVGYCINEEAAALTATPSQANYSLFYYTSEDGEPQSSIIPSTSEVGEFTYYVAEGESLNCISPNKSAITVIVTGGPEVTALENTEIEGCGTEFTSSSIPEFSTQLTTITQNTFENLGGTITSEKEILSIQYFDNLETTFPAVITRTFRINSECGNVDVQQVISVVDTVAPEDITLEDITEQCAAEVEAPVTTDNCDGEITGTTTDAITFTEQGNYSITWTFTDKSGNQTTAIQKVFIKDTVAPEITCQNDIFDTVDAGSTTAVVTYDTPVAADNCEFTFEQTAGFASGSEFPLGTTTNTFVVTDAAGNTATCSFDITITDDEDPTLECPAPINVNVGAGICGAVVEFSTPEGFDNSGDVTVTQIAGPVSGEVFPVGTTTVTFQVEDASGNTATCSFTVTVKDNEDPEITSVANITQNVDIDSCSATVEYEIPTATDNCEGVEVTLTEGLASGETFPLGETTVTYTATDAAGNTVTTTFTVTVVDNINPTIVCPENITQTIGDNGTTATVTYEVVAADNCEFTVEQTAGLASGSEFPMGTTTNIFVVTDAAGNTATCSFTVTITDDEDPTLECPEPINVNVDAGICGAVVEFTTPEGFDNSDDVTVTQIAGPVSGEIFPVGTTTVTFQVEDASGNTATCSFDVTVNDNEAPEITSVENITQNVDVDSCSATVEYELPTATDNCEGVTVEMTEGFASGEVFPLGETTVTYTATDAAGNTVTTTFTVTVVDNIAPEISCPSDIFDTVVSGGTTAVVTYNAPGASDNCEFTVEQTAGLASGSEFPLGTTTNTFVVTDAAGNTATCSFDVVITDDEDPTISCLAPINVNVDEGICGAVVEFTTPEGLDNSGDVTVTQIAGPVSGEVFPVGTTTVTFQVEDASGNTATCSFTVTVKDNEAPEITSVANITQNVGVDSCSATVAYELPTATDNCEGLTVELTEGLASGSEFPLGETTVTYTATDASGNTVTTTFTVTVVDNIAPEISCTNDIFDTVVSGGTTAIVTYDAPVASDNCSYTVEQTAGFASGSEFPLGTTTNTFVVTDAAGNTATCRFDVTITYDEDPTITCPAPLNVNVDAAICGAVVEFSTPEGFDNSGEVTVTQIAGPTSGEVFPVGTTTVTFQVEDASANTATCSFTVTVNDNEAPEITSVANITQNVDVDSCSAIVEYELPTATDNCDGAEVTLTEGLASGSEFPLGETTVTYTATDAAGNTVITTFTVTVVDNIAPEITCVNDIFDTVVSGGTTAVVTYDAPVASDNCSYTVEQTFGLASGSEFPLGTTTNTFVVTDAAGNTATCSFDVTITDDEDPTISCSAPLNVYVDTGICGAVVEFTTPEGFDNSGDVTVTQIAGPASGEVFPVGTTIVTFQMEDNSGNTATCSFDVTVTDNEAPEITSIANITQNVDVDSCSATVEYELPTATDNCDGVTVTLTEGLTSGEVFPLGKTTVTYTATDAAGNTVTTTFTVTVVDNISPEITCTNDIFETVGENGTTAVITYDAPVASDNCEFTVEQTAGLASGSEFPLGTTTNTFVVTDAAGNTASCSFDVVITDDEDPTITCPAPINVNVGAGMCGAVVEFSTPKGFDNSGDVTVTQIAGPASGEVFPVGVTTVTFQVEDNSGNTATCSFTVTVNDNEAPEITPVANITQNVDVDSCFATVEYELPTATDNCEGVTVILTEGLASGSGFPLGVTEVTYTATDASENTVTTTFTVTVVDNIAPEITCQNNIFETVGENGTTAVVTYEAPVASDNCEFTVEQTAGLPSGSEFPLGTTTNTFVVTDTAGNTATCSFDVTITDDEDPTLECPENIDVNVDAGICGAVVEFTTPEGFDNSGDVTVTQIAGPVSGEVFPVGITTVTFQVEDASGNTATCSFTVTVTDNEAPEITPVANITQNVDVDSCFATVEYELPTATDNCEGVTVILTEGLASGSGFPLGVTEVTYTATDSAGNTVTTIFTVTVVDNIDPTIVCPENISQTVSENGTSAIVSYDTVASDNCSYTVEQTEGLASGSEFPLGTTTNTFVVTDGSGNTATCSFNVTITDDEDPTITCPAPINVNVDAGICGAVVEFTTPEGFDNSGDVTVTQIAGPEKDEVFPVGTTTVTFKVEDASGNTATCSFIVTVNDNEAPEITSVANITQNVDVDSCSATVEYELPTATDNCEGVEVTLTQGLASGEVFPLGETTVTYTATDAAGNEVTTTFTVTVVDNIDPTIVCPNDISQPVGENGSTAIVTYEVTAADNCEFTVEQTAGLPSGSEFPLGTTTNTFVVTDGAGNTATCSFDVTITDDEDPTISCPENIDVNVDAGLCGAVVEITTPEGFDNSGDVTVTQIAGPVSGEVFPVGTTTVTFQVEDASGNTVTCSFEVTVNDNEAPEITSVANITQNVDVDSCSATVEYELPNAIDNCEGVEVTLTEGLASGEVFPLGETTVTYTATDAAGNTVTTTFTVTVVDSIAPEISCPNDIFDTVGENGTTAVVTYDAPVASDNCEFTIEQTAGLPSGSEFPLGTTTNTFVVTDAAGNTTTCSFDVIITDDEDPTLECPAPINVNVDEEICGAVVEFSAPEGADNSGDVTVTQIAGPVSGEVFPVGTTTVTFQVEDASGNTATCSFTVTVNDNKAPEITSVVNITQNVDVDSCSATVEYELPTASDNCEGVEVTLTEGLASGSEFPLGETTVTFTATDAAGNEVTTTFTVTVVDNIDPTIVCPGNITQTIGDNGSTATVTYEVVAADNCEFTFEQTAGLASGSEFPLGTTTNTFVVTDAAGNTATCSFEVTITDDEDPTISCPENIDVNVDEGTCGAVVEFDTPQGFDNSGNVTVTQIAGPVSGEVFPVGTTRVTFQVEDASGNTATCSFDVTVNDNEAPEIASGANITQNVDVDSCSATVEYELPTATDNCDGVTVEMTEGLASGEVFPLGVTEVTYTATDASGNKATTTFTVTVVDNIAPTAPVIASATGDCEVNITAPVAIDGCAREITGTTQDPLTYTESGAYSITWTFDDGNGNISTATQKVIIEDTSAPEWTSALPQDVSVECNNIPAAATLTAVDNCGVNVTFSEEMVASDCASEYLLTRTWTATDNSGNAISHTQIISVEDNSAPTLVGELQEVIDITCEEIPATPQLTFTDNCSPEVTVEFEDTTSDLGDASSVITRTWFVTDCAGNEAVFTQTINVNPTSTPIETTTIDLCTEDVTFELSDLLVGEYNENGTWVDSQQTGALQNGVIDPAMLQVGQYTFDYVINEGGCASTTTVQVSINDDCIVLPCEIEDVQNSISKTVTPNGDYINDKFEVGKGIDCGFTYSVKVFNRWGNEVYKSDNYTDDWDGTSGSSVYGNQLPSGTYYYIVEIKQSGLEPIQGYIYLGTK